MEKFMLFKSIRLTKFILLLILFPITIFAAETVSYNGDAWYGLYFGGDGGAEISNVGYQFNNANYFNARDSQIRGSNFKFKQSGVAGGGHLGFNLQHNLIVYGIEGSILNSTIKQTLPSTFFTDDIFTLRINQISLINAHLGIAYYPWLIYAKGGFANIKLKVSLIDNTNFVSSSLQERNNGYSIGAGVDYKITPFLSAGLTYDYIQTRAKNRGIGCLQCDSGEGPTSAPLVNVSINTSLVMARINYLMDLI